jgi:hypothetical protein
MPLAVSIDPFGVTKKHSKFVTPKGSVDTANAPVPSTDSCGMAK